jgi:putative transposase
MVSGSDCESLPQAMVGPLRYMASKYQKEFIAGVKEIYRASSLENAEEARRRSEENGARNIRPATAGWKNNWPHLSTFFSFPLESEE